MLDGFLEGDTIPFGNVPEGVAIAFLGELGSKQGKELKFTMIRYKLIHMYIFAGEKICVPLYASI